MSQRPPVPSYVFRGHISPIHSLHFFSDNTCIISGDSDGWIVIWNLATKRPVAVWRGHEGGIMGLQHWQHSKLISHGRDHKLRVWQLRPQDYSRLSTRLPVDGAEGRESEQPWLLHSLSVNALNYCSFSMCDEHANESAANEQLLNRSILIATSNGLDAGGIDVFQLPSEHRISKIPSDKEIQTGMVMAVAVFRQSSNPAVFLASGYESGHVLLHVGQSDIEGEWGWVRIMVHQPHSQPILSLDAEISGKHFYSSSADAIIIRFDTDSYSVDKKVDTKHAGQQDLKIRDDNKIFATAGWDKRIRVYSVKTLKELAVLKWHQEGCYATAFANTVVQDTPLPSNPTDDTLIRQAVDMLQKQQTAQARSIHWLAAGGKDGKISLWDIY